MAKKKNDEPYVTEQEQAIQKLAEQEIDIPETAQYEEPVIFEQAVDVEPQPTMEPGH